MSRKQIHLGHFEPPQVTVKAYITGFAVCIIITLLAYTVAMTNSAGDMQALIIVGLLAILQAIVQLRRFLHLGDEFAPKWKLWLFVTMLVIGIIVVAGSVWIMNNLNYRMMSSPSQVNQYVEGQDGL